MPVRAIKPLTDKILVQGYLMTVNFQDGHEIKTGNHPADWYD